MAPRTPPLFFSVPFVNAPFRADPSPFDHTKWGFDDKQRLVFRFLHEGTGHDILVSEDPVKASTKPLACLLPMLPAFRHSGFSPNARRLALFLVETIDSFNERILAVEELVNSKEPRASSESETMLSLAVSIGLYVDPHQLTRNFTGYPPKQNPGKPHESLHKVLVAARIVDWLLWNTEDLDRPLPPLRLHSLYTKETEPPSRSLKKWRNEKQCETWMRPLVENFWDDETSYTARDADTAALIGKDVTVTAGHRTDDFKRQQRITNLINHAIDVCMFMIAISQVCATNLVGFVSYVWTGSESQHI